jgi:hypothetical protein
MRGSLDKLGFGLWALGFELGALCLVLCALYLEWELAENPQIDN